MNRYDRDMYKDLAISIIFKILAFISLILTFIGLSVLVDSLFKI